MSVDQAKPYTHQSQARRASLAVWLIAAHCLIASPGMVQAQEPPSPPQTPPASQPATQNPPVQAPPPSANDPQTVAPPVAVPTPAPLPPATATPVPAAPGVLPPAATDPDETEAIVYLKDGQRYEGVLVEQNNERTVLRIAGISTVIRGELVESTRVLPPVTERYRDLRQGIDDGDIDQRLALIDWLVRRRKLDLALTEVLGIISEQPENTAANHELALIRKQIELRNRAPAPRPAGVKRDEPAARPAAEPEPSTPAVPLLSAEQVNLIKVYEIDLARPPTITIARDVIAKMLEQYSGHALVPQTKEGRDALLRQTPQESLDLMFRLRAREFYPMVKVQGQPEVMRRFKDDVHGAFIFNSCATSACHGGPAAGRLVLVNHRKESDQTVYTNFLILDRFHTDGGRPMIDWDMPERSPLLQLGLPREDSLLRHPVVMRSAAGTDAWKPTFRSTSDKRFQDTVAWIKSMYRPHPEYPVDYKPLRPFTATEGTQAKGQR